MKILSTDIQNKIEKLIITNCTSKKYDLAIENISKIIDELYANIPDNKRISYGRVHTVRVLSEYLSKQFSEIDAPTFELASIIFNKGKEFKSKSVALGIISFIGLTDFEKVIPYFESAAADDNWDVREIAQMFFKKIIKKYPDEMKEYLQKLVKSEDANNRRL